MRTIAIFIGVLTASAAAAHADQDPLNVAKDLYASAAYEEALSRLLPLSEGRASAPAVARQADQYRAFCLYALGRVSEAESITESLIRREPLLELDATDASPRVEAMFASVKKRVLPGLIRERYRATRDFIDQKQYAAAEPRLGEVRRLLDDAQRLGAWDDGLADLTVLVDGFLTLVHSQAPGAPPAATAAMAASQAAAPPALRPSEPAAAVPGDTDPDARIYRADDAGVVPPIAISQTLPSAPNELVTILRALHRQMLLDVVIDEMGNVERADIRVPLHPSYDAALVRAAAKWKYRPAMRNGVAVRYEKIVAIDVK